MELTEQKAKDIDEILDFSAKHGFSNSFDTSYYQKTKQPDLDSTCLIHLVGLLNHYMEKHERKWIGLDGKTSTCNNNTKAVLNSGSFQKIFENESRQELKEQTDLELALKMLKDHRITKIIAWLGLIISAIVAIVEIINAI